MEISHKQTVEENQLAIKNEQEQSRELQVRVKEMECKLDEVSLL